MVLPLFDLKHMLKNLYIVIVLKALCRYVIYFSQPLDIVVLLISFTDEENET